MKRLFKKYEVFSDESCILIYQMGKVGSTALEFAIPNALHLHTLYDNSPCHVHQSQRLNSPGKRIRSKIFAFIRRKAIRSRSKVKIITLVRDPVERDVSMFFQDLPHWLYYYIGKDNVTTKEEGFDLLLNAFFSAYDREYGINWFDKELKQFTGIDVYGRRFDRDRGYKEYENEKYQVLLIRLENLNNCQGVIEAFVGRSVHFQHQNSGDRKWYADVYKRFKNEVKCARFDNYVSSVESSKLYTHFYKDEGE